MPHLRARHLHLDLHLDLHVIALSLALLALGCGDSGSEAEPSAEAPAVAVEAPTEVRAEATAPSAPSAPTSPPPGSALPELAADQQIDIPAGPARIGSRPGTPNRRPRAEADAVIVELPAFRIDRLPYPNDPAQPPRTGVTRRQASVLCEERGARLCSELEWERACLGGGPGPYSTGSALDLEACGRGGEGCQSTEGVVGMGVLVDEWTSSAVSQGLGNEERSAVVRGSGANATTPFRRCAARQSSQPGASRPDLGFRCCHGEADEVAYPTVPSSPRMQVREIERAELRALLASVPELAPYAPGFRLFSEVEIQNVLARGGKTVDDLFGWELLVGGILRWTPTPGEETLALTGTNGSASLVAVLYVMPDGSHVHAASFVVEEEGTPIALAHTLGSMKELQWSTCWGCMGEGGVVSYREDGTLVVSQR